LEFYAVNSNYPEEEAEHNEPRKLKADLFLDDRNLGGLPDWGIIYQMIVSGKFLEPVTNEVQSEYNSPRKGLFQTIFGK